MYEKKSKNGSTKIVFISKPTKIFFFKFEKTILKPPVNWYENLKLRYFEVTEKQPVKEHHGPPGSNRPGIFIMWSRRKRFCSLSHIKKFNSFWDMALFESPV